MQRKKLDREAILVALDDFKADFAGKGNSLLSRLLLSRLSLSKYQLYWGIMQIPW